jgi:hypothetical protein
LSVFVTENGAHVNGGLVAAAVVGNNDVTCKDVGASVVGLVVGDMVGKGEGGTVGKDVAEPEPSTVIAPSTCRVPLHAVFIKHP